MPTPSRTLRPLARLCALGCSLALAAGAPTLFIGCAPRPPAPTEADAESGFYDGPPITLDLTGIDAVAVLEAPSPGWQFTFLASAPRAGGRDVFVTLRRPDPAMVYPQVITTMRAATDVRSTTDIRLFARVLDARDEETGPREGFRPVLSVAQ